MFRRSIAAPIAMSILSTSEADATFSIVAVDPVTGQVGSAGASCIAGSIILSDVHPDVGVIHTQSFYNAANQNFASSLMDQGFSPQSIVDQVVANDAQGNPTVRQYAVVDLVGGGRSAAYTGVNCFDYKGDVTGATYAVAGNILSGPSIIASMESAFTSTGGTLADRLMAALQAANVPGADTRCTTKPAISAFIRVAFPGDAPSSLTLDLNVNNTASGENPIDELQLLYDDWVGTVSAPESSPPADHPARIFPNPLVRADVVTVEVAGAGTIELYSVTGRRLVQTFIGNGRTASLPLPARLPNGTYFVRITTDRSTRVERLVISR